MKPKPKPKSKDWPAERVTLAREELKAWFWERAGPTCYRDMQDLVEWMLDRLTIPELERLVHEIAHRKEARP